MAGAVRRSLKSGYGEESIWDHSHRFRYRRAHPVRVLFREWNQRFKEYQSGDRVRGAGRGVLFRRYRPDPHYKRQVLINEKFCFSLKH